uniref:ATP synthase complex subunit 8 n=1 Tax=Rhyzodiastes puetzi TaxID=2983424 RepID=A0A977TJ42_9CARA|nr:ATP synthase F0 subunit 8 [Rhyzodiastes puetzi]UXW64215.1 ATP synthase F0 subunit 8 [Rhyzodiastes puetzi]
MPQMAPLHWLIMFILFLLIFILLNSMNYYNSISLKSTPMKNNITEIYSIWKW